MPQLMDIAEEKLARRIGVLLALTQGLTLAELEDMRQFALTRAWRAQPALIGALKRVARDGTVSEKLEAEIVAALAGAGAAEVLDTFFLKAGAPATELARAWQLIQNDVEKGN